MLSIDLRFLSAALCCALLLPPGALLAESAALGSTSGTYRGRVITELFRHRQAESRREGTAALTAEPRVRQDQGEIAIIDTSSGVLAQPNFFDLQGLSLFFTPNGGGFEGSTTLLMIDQAAQVGGVPLDLSDDDAERVDLLFDFPFFGKSHRSVFVHSDGNLTFEEPDSRSDTRSLARAVAGPPRIAPYFLDFDPSQPQARVRAYNLPDRSVITWDGVPPFSAGGSTRRQTFQVELHGDGSIAFHYRTANLTSAVVGLFPGRLTGEVEAVDLSVGFGASSAVGFAELFELLPELDIYSTAQQFFRSHGDAYDFLVVFNNFGLSPGPGSFAFEVNVRNETLGIGDLLSNSARFDFGHDFGSPRRLSSFINMGPLSAYPQDPTMVIPLIGENNTLSVMGQEVGHRWLSYVDFIDPATGFRSGNLLGRGQSHWSFFFNSNASVVEGNRIEDKGLPANPRFETVETVARYSELDQYIMGLRAAEETPASFLVDQPTGAGSTSRSRAPQTGVSFNGIRKDVPLDLIIAAEGPRIPAYDVAQKEFNLAFALVVQQGMGEVSEEDLDKIDGIRREFEQFFEQAVGSRAEASTALVKRLELSAWPAAGVLAGDQAQATLTVDEPRATDLDVALDAVGGLSVPAVVTIPTGESSAAFTINGLAPGVGAVMATAFEAGYDQPRARIQVLESAADLTLEIVSGNNQSGVQGELLAEPVVVAALDHNRLPYSGVSLLLEPSAGGEAGGGQASTDASGLAIVNWRLGPQQGEQQVIVRLGDSPANFVSVQADAVGEAPVFTSEGVVNAASFNQDTEGVSQVQGLSPGGLISIFGSGLAAGDAGAAGFPLPRELGGVSVRINGVSAPLIFASQTQINLQLPFHLAGSSAEFIVTTPAGASDVVSVALGAVQPGLFYDPASGFGAIVFTDGLSPWNRPARAGEALQIFATGLGAVTPPTETGEPASTAFLSYTDAAVTVVVDGLRLTPIFAGLAPGFSGLYQVNVALPPDLSPGEHLIAIEAGGLRGNRARLQTAE